MKFDTAKDFIHHVYGLMEDQEWKGHMMIMIARNVPDMAPFSTPDQKEMMLQLLETAHGYNCTIKEPQPLPTRLGLIVALLNCESNEALASMFQTAADLAHRGQIVERKISKPEPN